MCSYCRSSFLLHDFGIFTSMSLGLPMGAGSARTVHNLLSDQGMPMIGTAFFNPIGRARGPLPASADGSPPRYAGGGGVHDEGVRAARLEPQGRMKNSPREGRKSACADCSRRFSAPIWLRGCREKVLR